MISTTGKAWVLQVIVRGIYTNIVFQHFHARGGYQCSITKKTEQKCIGWPQQALEGVLFFFNET